MAAATRSSRDLAASSMGILRNSQSGECRRILGGARQASCWRHKSILGVAQLHHSDRDRKCLLGRGRLVFPSVQRNRNDLTCNSKAGSRPENLPSGSREGREPRITEKSESERARPFLGTRSALGRAAGAVGAITEGCPCLVIRQRGRFCRARRALRRNTSPAEFQRPVEGAPSDVVNRVLEIEGIVFREEMADDV